MAAHPMIAAMLPDDDRWSSSVIRDLLAQARRPDVYSLAGGLPAAESLPVERMETAVRRVFETYGGGALQYGLSRGEPPLIEQLATSSGSDSERILVTTGSQQALNLLARILTPPTESDTPAVVVLDDPGYVGAVQILTSHSYELVGIPVDSDGLRVDVLAERLASGLRPKFCYTNPAFQNPTGATLSAERALELVRLAEEYKFLVIADDPYIELYLDGERPLPLPQSPWVARMGSMSKVAAPGLRIGWVDADPALIDRLTQAKQAADLHTSTLNQLMVADLMSDTAWWGRHLEALRADYRRRRQTLTSAIASQLPGSSITPQHGGFFLWVDLGDPSLDLMKLLPKAVEAGMAFVPGAAFAIDQSADAFLRLSYSNGDTDRFEDAIKRLASVL